MNNKSAFPFLASLLALLAFGLVAVSPLLALGYRVIVFTVAPALQAVNVAVLGH